MYSGSGDLPKHIYCFVDSSFIRTKGKGFEPCVWFAIRSWPGRAWGCHIMLECGAIYRDVPPHALAFRQQPADPWLLDDAQRWNCYGTQFSTIEYTFLQGLNLRTRQIRNEKEELGQYLFTAVPLNDGYTEEPAQAKEFVFCQLFNYRLTILPTNMVLFKDASFGKAEWPENLQPASDKWKVFE